MSWGAGQSAISNLCGDDRYEGGRSSGRSDVMSEGFEFEFRGIAGRMVVWPALLPLAIPLTTKPNVQPPMRIGVSPVCRRG